MKIPLQDRWSADFYPWFDLTGNKTYFPVPLAIALATDIPESFYETNRNKILDSSTLRKLWYLKWYAITGAVNLHMTGKSSVYWIAEDVELEVFKIAGFTLLSDDGTSHPELHRGMYIKVSYSGNKYPFYNVLERIVAEKNFVWILEYNSSTPRLDVQSGDFFNSSPPDPLTTRLYLFSHANFKCNEGMNAQDIADLFEIEI